MKRCIGIPAYNRAYLLGPKLFGTKFQKAATGRPHGGALNARARRETLKSRVLVENLNGKHPNRDPKMETEQGGL